MLRNQWWYWNNALRRAGRLYTTVPLVVESAAAVTERTGVPLIAASQTTEEWVTVGPWRHRICRPNVTVDTGAGKATDEIGRLFHPANAKAVRSRVAKAKAAHAAAKAGVTATVVEEEDGDDREIDAGREMRDEPLSEELDDARLLLPEPAYVIGEKKKTRRHAGADTAAAAEAREEKFPGWIWRAYSFRLHLTQLQIGRMKAAMRAYNETFNRYIRAVEKYDIHPDWSYANLASHLVSGTQGQTHTLKPETIQKRADAKAARGAKRPKLTAEAQQQKDDAARIRQERIESDRKKLKLVPRPEPWMHDTSAKIRKLACADARAALTDPNRKGFRYRTDSDPTATLRLEAIPETSESSPPLRRVNPLRNPGETEELKRWERTTKAATTRATNKAKKRKAADQAAGVDGEGAYDEPAAPEPVAPPAPGPPPPEFPPVRNRNGVERRTNCRRKWAHIELSNNLSDVGPVRVRDKTELIDRLIRERVLSHEGKIHWDRRTNRWYLLVMWPRDIAIPPPPKPGDVMPRVLSLDPGIKSFQTFYTDDGIHGELLTNIVGSPPVDRTADIARREAVIKERVGALTTEDHARHQWIKALVHRVGRAQTFEEWHTRRRAARHEREAIPRETKTRYNRIKAAKRKLARIKQVAAGETGIQARFDRIDWLYGKRNRLRQKRQDEDWHVHNVKDKRSVRHWKRRAIRERQVMANQVKTAHYVSHRTTLGLAPVNILPRWATNSHNGRIAKAMNHFKYRQRLISAAEGYRGPDPVTGKPGRGDPEPRMVWLCAENGTTKTCGQCGRWNGDMTLADRVYDCKRCGAKMGRDVNGARSNMLAPATALLGFAPKFDGMEDVLAGIRERARQKRGENGAVATRTTL